MSYLNQSEFEIRKEEISGSIRAIDIEILEAKKRIRENRLEAVRIDIETSREGVTKSRLALKSAQIENALSEQQIQQLDDNLKYERAMTLMNQRMLHLRGKSALLELQRASAEFEGNQGLFEIMGVLDGY